MSSLDKGGIAREVLSHINRDYFRFPNGEGVGGNNYLAAFFLRKSTLFVYMCAVYSILFLGALK